MSSQPINRSGSNYPVPAYQLHKCKSFRCWNFRTQDDVAVLKIRFNLQKTYPLTISSKIPRYWRKTSNIRVSCCDSGMYSDFNQTIIKPSSISGIFTAEVPNNGTTYYETNANAVHGYSGGPVSKLQQQCKGNYHL